jgi:hypothetical protein
MARGDLRFAAARFSTGLIRSEELRTVADEALSQGVYSYSLGELGTLAQPTWRESAPLFEAALYELDIAVPPIPEALVTVLAARIRALAEQVVTMGAGLREVFELCDHDAFANAALDDGDRTRVRELLLHYDLYDYFESTEPDSMEARNQSIAELASTWSLEFGRRSLDPAWLTWNHGTVPAIARHIYNDRAFHDLPLLADALEDAGCTDPYILAHCRGGGEHVRGCWVVDLILGKT